MINANISSDEPAKIIIDVAFTVDQMLLLNAVVGKTTGDLLENFWNDLENVAREFDPDNSRRKRLLVDHI